MFRVEARTLASSIDAMSKKYRSDNGRYWTSNIVPSHEVGLTKVRATDVHGQNEHKCWVSFDIKELIDGSEVSATVCTNAHQSVKLKEQVLRKLAQVYPEEISAEKKIPSQMDADSEMSTWSRNEGASSGASRPDAPARSAEFTVGSGLAVPAAQQPPPEPMSPPETLEAALERIDQLERGLTETNSAVRLIHQEIQRATGEVQVVSKRVEGILLNLKATLGYCAHDIYVCGSCHSMGEVAARVKCTHCGQENWWGWWPSNKSPDDSPDDKDSINWLSDRLR